LGKDSKIMKFTLSWLADHLDTTASLDVICDTLTAIGLEVEGVEDPAAALGDFIVGHVLSADPHPDADRLRVCKVDTGAETLQIVCGAPNARAGIKVVLARPGVTIPDSGTVLKTGVIRGVESCGMMCSARELKLSDEHAGIIELPADAVVGAPAAAALGLNDPVIEINLTPNRGDCAGVRGIARDLAAAGIGTLKPLNTPPVVGTFDSPISVTLAAGADCPHFAGRMIRGVKNGPSPDWMQKRLTAIGLRPISALVDVTNYITFDLGRPLHVFDADKVKGNLQVRPAKDGEVLEALNGKTYTLSGGMTVVADDAGPEALGGIIGGVASSCQMDTVSVFLECANFEAGRVAKTGRELGVITDARYRLERGIDPAFTETGADIGARLIMYICGGEASHPVIAGSAPLATRQISLRQDRMRTRAGVDVPEGDQVRILTALGCGVTVVGSDLKVTPPSWRPDIHGEADLVEEILRIYGFDRIPVTSMVRSAAVTPCALTSRQRRDMRIRRALAGQGLMEAVTWSFMPYDLATEFGQIAPDLRLVNPISADLDTMRPTVLANLIAAAGRNADRGLTDGGLFEIGPIFPTAIPGEQRLVAAGLRFGRAEDPHWSAPARPVDAFDAKADALAALAAGGVPTANLQVDTNLPDWYHPGRAGALRLGPTLFGYFGELHPALLKKFGCTGPVVAFEVFLDAIPEKRDTKTARPLLKLAALQPVTRDFAFVVAADTPADKLLKAIKGADKALIKDAAVFDIYTGKGIEDGQKSLAITVTLQPADKTLTDAEIEAVSAKIIAASAKAAGAVLRG
jgi:phenylalanyl-tRNA synthetase beta chain